MARPPGSPAHSPQWFTGNNNGYLVYRPLELRLSTASILDQSLAKDIEWVCQHCKEDSAVQVTKPATDVPAIALYLGK
jgi:hypothetical protein